MLHRGKGGGRTGSSEKTRGTPAEKKKGEKRKLEKRRDLLRAPVQKLPGKKGETKRDRL